jgi:hypothetical protein
MPGSRPPLPPALVVEKSQPLAPIEPPMPPEDVDERRAKDRSWFGSPQQDQSRGTWHGGPVARGPAKRNDEGEGEGSP